MQAAPMRFVGAALWPLSIWTSLTHLEEHPADDYVERTSPIVATAIGFWICVAAIIAVVVLNGAGSTIMGDGGPIHVARRPSAALGALWVILPVLYVIGFWLFTAREERYPR